MSDLIYVLLTLAGFAGLALLVGLIDGRLGVADERVDAGIAPAAPGVAAAEPASASVSHDGPISGAAR
ncbi:MAG: hypothetical protein ACRDPS_21740 [Nocardioides sp.]|uniref:hypothetical protein n=1 Tax=Nocardioides sp. TaxID=35761 RepID=UPI003D6B7081